MRCFHEDCWVPVGSALQVRFGNTVMVFSADNALTFSYLPLSVTVLPSRTNLSIMRHTAQGVPLSLDTSRGETKCCIRNDIVAQVLYATSFEKNQHYHDI